MAVSRNVEDVVEVVVPRLQDAVAAEVRNLAQELAARAEAVRAETVAEHEASLARERRQAMTERAEAISAAAAVAREQAASSVVSRLLEAVRRLGEQSTLSGVLDALADLAGAEAGRSALFVVTEGGLRVWRLVGFDALDDAPGRVLEAADAGVAARAIDARCSVAVTGGADGSPERPPAFAVLSDDHAGVAVPVMIGNEPLVAVYADEGQAGPEANSARWVPAIEILARYAGSRLEALVAERAAALARSVAPPSRRAAARHAGDGPAG